ncbi:DUF2652 domain-containing protein [Sphingobacterium thalpophilum]|uniref:DUF2652 domain-containing protein n=1 Tax=Sphingobacterium thalpophilum TaxID=259 RepID=UPI0024A6F234|nr:DUF2652 domain-containing protein [Sphingobacterium thalpophilum]
MNYSNKDKDIKNGIIIIPDISGYTRFVHNVDQTTGRIITYELLSAIISNNELSLNVSEIEGDAVLFYRYGYQPILEELVNQFERMLNSFNKKVEEISLRMGKGLSLSLKMIVHYGSFSEYNINGFTKLYGETVIEAHRLLKNSINSDCYLLITDKLFDNCNFSKGLHPNGLQAMQLCEVYGELRNICYCYYDYHNDSVLPE